MNLFVLYMNIIVLSKIEIHVYSINDDDDSQKIIVSLIKSAKMGNFLD